MVPVISFIGSSGSGKTTLLEKVVAELKTRGMKIAVIKHVHDDLSFDKNGKDSKRYAAAGADTVIVSGPREIAVIKKTDHDMSTDELAVLIDPGIDLVLTEGFKYGCAYKIEVHRNASGRRLLSAESELLAVVTDETLDVGVPQFDFEKDNTVEISDFIEKWLSDRRRKESELTGKK